MRLQVNNNKLVIPQELLEGLTEVEVSRKGDAIFIKKVANTTAEKKKVPVSIVKGEVAKKLFLEKQQKIATAKENIRTDLRRLALGEEFRQLCKETQELHADRPLSAEEIAAEIDAVRGEK
ncbi:MAG: hypothetical protein F6K35_51380 [Okeania sp. SIO2H7]|nr:hypothetical protein [Okeania sp. SIO2H7]